MKDGILFDEAGLVVVNKPPGVSLATPRSDPHSAVRRLVAALPSEEILAHALEDPDLRLVHRLDSGTSGLVMLARDGATHRELTTLLGSRAIRKTYLALVWGHPRPSEGIYSDPIGPDRKDRRRMRVDPQGRAALSPYRVLASTRYVSLLELRPETGRTHQLRVHLSHAGHPVVGDDLYAGPRHRAVREKELRDALHPPHLLLHAWRLVLPPCRVAAELYLEAPLPPAFCAALVRVWGRGLDLILPPGRP